MNSKINYLFIASIVLFVSTLSAAPFPGSNNVVPGTIEIEDFDLGGEGVAYHDDEAGNQMAVNDWFDSLNIYRQVDGKDVDLNYNAALKNQTLGYIVNGEWLNFTLKSVIAGRYKVDVYTASPFDDKKNKVLIEIEGEDAFEVQLQRTGSWGDWAEQTAYFNITSNKRDVNMKVTFLGDGYNVDKIVFDLDQAGAYKPHSIPGTIEAEDYDIGPNRSNLNGAPANTAAYNDEQAGNQLLPYLIDTDEYRPGDGVDIGHDQDGYHVGWIEDGEWMKYSIGKVEDGNYNVIFRLATDKNMPNNNKVKVKLDNKTICEVRVPNSGGWGKWSDVYVRNVAISGSSKGRKMQLLFDGDGSYNLSSVRFEKLAADEVKALEDKKGSNVSSEEDVIALTKVKTNENKPAEIPVNYEILMPIVNDYSVVPANNKIGVKFKMPNSTVAGTNLPYTIRDENGKTTQKGGIVIKKGLNSYVFELDKSKYEFEGEYLIEINGIVKGQIHKIKFVYKY